MGSNIPMMTTEWPWNPNHKYKFYVLGVVGPHRWLLTVWFSNKDQSVYVKPEYTREFAVQLVGSGQRKSYRHRPGADFHLSLHETGAVKLTTSETQTFLREELSAKKDVRHVVTFQINSIENFPTANLEEINKPKGGYLYLPVVGFPSAPLMLTAYCVRESTDWSPPSMGNTMMNHYKTKMTGKDYNFHFVVWQNLGMQKGEGDIALQFGGEDDTFYGL